ncbi:hypothetical protein BASA60_011096 [Batrachochytrium salamandrivorans]|nr:hypothetical protein BASA60_011096 [Batrachochytrium salamandrivorans]KAH9256204.1 hypothetical protein BASA81_005713 [Batrachochytrium salamandrivorans]KAH9268419.1 hypothetical protein BASA83_009418 [Batrachochytrium salamandrivorans]
MVASSYYSRIPSVQCSQCGEPFDFGSESTHRCRTGATEAVQRSRPEMPSIPDNFKSKSNHRMSLKYASQDQNSYPNARNTYNSRVDSFLDVYGGSSYESPSNRSESPLAKSRSEPHATHDYDDDDDYDDQYDDLYEREDNDNDAHDRDSLYDNGHDDYYNDHPHSNTQTPALAALSGTNGHKQSAGSTSLRSPVSPRALHDDDEPSSSRYNKGTSERGGGRVGRQDQQRTDVKSGNGSYKDYEDMDELLEALSSSHVDEPISRQESKSSGKDDKSVQPTTPVSSSPAKGFLGTLGGFLGILDHSGTSSTPKAPEPDKSTVSRENSRNDAPTVSRNNSRSDTKSIERADSRSASRSDTRGDPRDDVRSVGRSNTRDASNGSGSTRPRQDSRSRSTNQIDAARSNSSRSHHREERDGDARGAYNEPGPRDPLGRAKSEELNTRNDYRHAAPQDSSNTVGPRHTCADCKASIVDLRDAFEIEALGAWYHVDCFKCTTCRRRFGDDVPYVPHLGQAFCESDYERYFLEMCIACKKPITDGNVAHALGKSFHEHHLRCSVCRMKIQPGRHFEHQGKLFCHSDFSKLSTVTCVKCRGPIQGDSVHAIGALYHRQCFSCTQCRTPFPDKKFFVFKNRPYCQTHYHEKNNSLCGTCTRPIEGPCVDVAEMGRRFHPSCWCCGYCKQALTGVYYAYSGRAYCEADISKVHRPGSNRQAPTKRRTMMSYMN